jgi:hypothetical protein
LGGLDFAGIDLAENSRTNQACEQTDDDHDDQHFEQGKAARRPTRINGMARGKSTWIHGM